MDMVLPGCPDADFDVSCDGKSGIDDAIGIAVTQADWVRAADKRRDLGSRNPATPSHS